MIMSSNGNIFHVTGRLWGDLTDHRWIPITKANDAELWCFLWSAPEQTVEQTIETLVIWDAIALIMMSLQWFCVNWMKFLPPNSVYFQINYHFHHNSYFWYSADSWNILSRSADVIGVFNNQSDVVYGSALSNLQLLPRPFEWNCSPEMDEKKKNDSCTYDSLRPSGTYVHQQTRSSLVQIMACHLFAAKPLS